MIRNGHTDIVLIEDPVAGTLEADLLIPIPGRATDIGNLLDGSKHTGSFNEIVTNIAGHTISTLIVSVTLIGDGNTDSVVIEYPIAGALEASLLVPIPGGTSHIGHFLDGSQDTGAIHKVISNIAGDAISTLVIGVALV